MRQETDVAVIGSGFSAVALALNLVELAPPTARISLVGAREAQGRGIAYATTADCHRLNVPAGRMSLFADRPDHFTQWLAENSHAATAGDFAPRRLYGDYIGDCLDAALKRTANRAALTLVDAEAQRAEALADGGLLFHLSDGSELAARVSALCTGAGTGRLPLPDEAISEEVRPFVVQNPWDGMWWNRLPDDGDVLFVGTGLTMVDQCLRLARTGFRGTMHAVSRHGLLPQAHLAHRADPLAPVLQSGEVSTMLATLRAAASALPDWRAVMDGLRPVTQDLWRGWTPEQQRRFLRHAAPFWNVHRHCMAPAVAAEIAALRETGRLVVQRGRLQALHRQGDGVIASVQGRLLSVAMVVNCTGFERCTVSASPLLSSLAAKGIVAPHPIGLGIAVDDHSAVPTSEGRLYAMGPLTAGRHFEITAVPDIRVQARSVAGGIAAEIARS
nr:FAD/NAD(P)-binding protein [uncultured Shinella sp.]